MAPLRWILNILKEFKKDKTEQKPMLNNKWWAKEQRLKKISNHLMSKNLRILYFFNIFYYSSIFCFKKVSNVLNRNHHLAYIWIFRKLKETFKLGKIKAGNKSFQEYTLKSSIFGRKIDFHKFLDQNTYQICRFLGKLNCFFRRG